MFTPYGGGGSGGLFGVKLTPKKQPATTEYLPPGVLGTPYGVPHRGFYEHVSCCCRAALIQGNMANGIGQLHDVWIALFLLCTLQMPPPPFQALLSSYHLGWAPESIASRMMGNIPSYTAAVCIACRYFSYYLIAKRTEEIKEVSCVCMEGVLRTVRSNYIQYKDYYSVAHRLYRDT